MAWYDFFNGKDRELNGRLDEAIKAFEKKGNDTSTLKQLQKTTGEGIDDVYALINGYGPTEEMPQFPGGEVELLKFIYNNLKKPSIDDGCQVMGKVVCRFIIDIDGSVIQPEVIRSLTLSCDKEAIRVIKLLPKFIPGKQNGKNVRVWYTIPITFKSE